MVSSKEYLDFVLEQLSAKEMLLGLPIIAALHFCVSKTQNL